MDILIDKWSSAITISKLLISISRLLDRPELHNTIMTSIGLLYQTNKSKYMDTARE